MPTKELLMVNIELKWSCNQDDIRIKVIMKLYDNLCYLQIAV